MLHWKPFTPLALIAIIFTLSGCPGSHSNFLPSRASASVAPATKLPDAPPVAQQEARVSPKHPPRDSAFSVYHNPDYGVAFRYPRNFALQEQSEADESDADAAQAQQDLTAEQPGALLVATISIPGDAYPNTTFRSGALQFVVNSEATPEACREFANTPDSDWYGTTGTVTLQGITFYWQEDSSTSLGATYKNRDYAGFSNDTCYEFRIEVVASDNFDFGPETKPADVSKIFRTLEKIVLTLQLHPAPAPAAPPSNSLPPASPILSAFSSAPSSSIPMISTK